MSAELCFELLVVTIIAWVGVWGIVQELVEIVESRLHSLLCTYCTNS